MYERFHAIENLPLSLWDSGLFVLLSRGPSGVLTRSTRFGDPLFGILFYPVDDMVQAGAELRGYVGVMTPTNFYKINENHCSTLFLKAKVPDKK